jgi:predicted ATPase
MNLKNIRIKNLRSLKDTHNINLKPLTVLVGKNSSGKSTFLRFFPLLKQTLETRINEPVLWYSSRYVDFGSFEESLNRNSKNQLISFSFEFELNPIMLKLPFISHNLNYFYDDRYILSQMSKQNLPNIDCYISIEFGKNNLENLFFRCADQEIKIKKSNNTNSKLIDIVINNKEIKNVFFMSETEVGNLIPQIFSQVNEKKFATADEYFRRELFALFKNMAYQTTTNETIEEYFQTSFGSREQILKNLKDKKSSAQVLSKNVRKLDIYDEIFKDINNNFVGLYLNQIISVVNSYLKKYFSSVKYIAPLRASAERYYRIQGISINEVDPQGENIPMLIQNMSEGEKYRFDNWLLENFKFKICSNLESGHSSLKIQYENGYEVNLADTGFGYSQILPILLILWQANETNKINDLKKTQESYWWVEPEFDPIINIVIEQPELHLHPALQAMLMDSFVRIINLCMKHNINIHIIIETHSETIINRIGYLIAKNFEEFNKDLVNILILDNSKDNYDTKIQSTSYTEEGFLQEWPFGFFSPEEVEC